MVRPDKFLVLPAWLIIEYKFCGKITDIIWKMQEIYEIFEIFLLISCMFGKKSVPLHRFFKHIDKNQCDGELGKRFFNT